MAAPPLNSSRFHNQRWGKPESDREKMSKVLRQLLNRCFVSNQDRSCTVGHLAGGVLRPREDQLYPLRFPEGGHTDGQGPRRHSVSRLQLQWEDCLLGATPSTSAVPTCQRSIGAPLGRRSHTVTWGKWTGQHSRLCRATRLQWKGLSSRLSLCRPYIFKINMPFLF